MFDNYLVNYSMVLNERMLIYKVKDTYMTCLPFPQDNGGLVELKLRIRNVFCLILNLSRHPILTSFRWFFAFRLWIPPGQIVRKNLIRNPNFKYWNKKILTSIVEVRYSMLNSYLYDTNPSPNWPATDWYHYNRSILLSNDHPQSFSIINNAIDTRSRDASRADAPVRDASATRKRIPQLHALREVTRHLSNIY